MYRTILDGLNRKKSVRVFIDACSCDRKIIFYGTSYSFSIIKRIRSRGFRGCEVNERIFFFNREIRYKISSLSNLSRYENIFLDVRDLSRITRRINHAIIFEQAGSTEFFRRIIILHVVTVVHSQSMRIAFIGVPFIIVKIFCNECRYVRLNIVY